MKTFEARMQYYRDLVQDRLKQVVTKKQPRSFYEPVEYIMESEGKRIRPILLLLACQAVGGDVSRALDASIAVEILHNFTLVHDDIMDQDDLRRGRPTVHKKWDVATAILVGDGLVGLAYHYLLKSKSDRIQEIAAIFTQGIIELCEGQALDKEFESRLDIHLDEYLVMIEKKTAQLLMVATEIGAIIGGGTAEQQHLLREFARELGNAFQIQDDLLDMELTSRKTFGSDIKQRKRTFLFIHALNTASAALTDKIMAIFQKDTIDVADILAVRQMFDDNGTLQFARQEVAKRFDRAQLLLQQMPASAARADLAMLCRWLNERKF
ncbi:MAG: polyprenyl synthetase family protein [candidate division KSB1 bacterium]|nr:polyprenyl synthetase family protein [candidate division KSB1 bacterium]